jgi:hypothetical protein
LPISPPGYLRTQCRAKGGACVAHAGCILQSHRIEATAEQREMTGSTSITGSQLAELGFRRDDVDGQWHAANCEVRFELLLGRVKIEVRLLNGSVIGCFGRRCVAFTEVTNR